MGLKVRAHLLAWHFVAEWSCALRLKNKAEIRNNLYAYQGAEQLNKLGFTFTVEQCTIHLKIE